MGITPDKLNEDGVIYKDDITDIMEAKKLISKGQQKIAKREAWKARRQSNKTR